MRRGATAPMVIDKYSDATSPKPYTLPSRDATYIFEPTLSQLWPRQRVSALFDCQNGDLRHQSVDVTVSNGIGSGSNSEWTKSTVSGGCARWC